LLVLRDTTERPEVIEAGCAKLVGTDEVRIVQEVSMLLNDRAAYAAMSNRQNPFGDGRAAERIASILDESLQGRPARQT
jgi:UDP-N-acetylglucosamine 2-epimerase